MKGKSPPAKESGPSSRSQPSRSRQFTPAFPGRSRTLCHPVRADRITATAPERAPITPTKTLCTLESRPDKMRLDSFRRHPTSSGFTLGEALWPVSRSRARVAKPRSHHRSPICGHEGRVPQVQVPVQGGGTGRRHPERRGQADQGQKDKKDKKDRTARKPPMPTPPRRRRRRRSSRSSPAAGRRPPRHRRHRHDGRRGQEAQGRGGGGGGGPIVQGTAARATAIPTAVVMGPAKGKTRSIPRTRVNKKAADDKKEPVTPGRKLYAASDKDDRPRPIYYRVKPRPCSASTTGRSARRLSECSSTRSWRTCSTVPSGSTSTTSRRTTTRWSGTAASRSV